MVEIEDCQKKAAEIGFDLTKQFLTLALAGIAFVVGLSFSTPGSISSLMLWLVVVVFGVSAVLGILFLMHGVNLLSISKTYDIYSTSLRILAGLQISLVLVGAILLIPILRKRPTTTLAATPRGSVEIKTGGSEQAVTYTIGSDKRVTIEVDGGKVKITTAKD